MKLNYTVDSNNYIVSLTETPFDAGKPFIEVSAYPVIGVDKIVGGAVTRDQADATSYTTAKETTTREIRIIELKSNLRSTDYLAIKYAEGQLTADEYATTKAQRQAWRDEINALEAQIAKE